jgi:DNA-binding NarL/FixJ family response regulator
VDERETSVTIRVLVADDQPLIRAGIAMLLDAETDIDVVGETDNGREAVDLARSLQPDIVLMDVRMPEVDGVQATSVITDDNFSVKPGKSIKVLILTTYNIDETVYRALRARASGFLLKHAAPTELVAAVRAIAAGDGWLDPAVTPGLLREFAARPERLRPAPSDLDHLTARERDVLVLVAHGLSNSEIAERLVIGQGTVKTHYSRVLMKLALRDRAQAVAAAYQTGLVRAGGALPPVRGSGSVPSVRRPEQASEHRP